MASSNSSRVLSLLAAAAVAIPLALSTLADPAVSGSTDLSVTKTADTNDGTCNSDCSLREAIVYANTFGADSINLPAGTYRLTRAGTNEDLAATGDLDIRKGVVIRGEGARATIIDGNGLDRVFHTPFQNTPATFTVLLFGVKVTGGAVSGPGGGIFHEAEGDTLYLSRSTVSGNQSDVGGGILTQRGPLTIVESTISGNAAPGGQGGGMQIGGTTTSKPNTITNTTVSGNRSRLGGGIVFYDPITISDSTIAFNTAEQPGAGLFAGGGPGPITLANTIVSNNASDSSQKNCNRDDFVDSNGNNLERGTSCGLSEPTDLNADPNLGPLENNGGATNTHALLSGSPAINAGGDPFPPTDQRGIARPQGFANDIGAVERRQDINVVLCPTGGTNPDACLGTRDADALVGRDVYDQVQGKRGDDVYNGKGGCDAYSDGSGSDRYLITVREFCNVGISSLSIQDAGGGEDVLDLSRVYASTDFVFERVATNLSLDGPGVNNIDVPEFFEPDGSSKESIELFEFSDRTLTARQIRNMTD